MADIKIDYGAVDKAATEVLKLGNSMKNELDDTMKTVIALGSAWDSSAYEALKQDYEKFAKQFDPMQKDIQALSKSLQDIREAYQKLDEAFAK